MYIDIIKAILNSSISDTRKLDKISQAVRKAEEIENLAVRIAKDDVGYAGDARIEPLWEHRAKAVQVLKSRERAAAPDLDDNELREHLHGAMDYLKRTIVENASWEIKEPFDCLRQKGKPTESSRPLRMLGVAPWEIGLCVSALNDWLDYVRHDVVEPSDEDKTALDLLRKGNQYLRRVQLALGNGGLGDSFWFGRPGPNDPETTGNTVDTSLAIAGWLQSSARLLDPISIPVVEAIGYLAGCRREDDGWGYKPFFKSDVKSTSMAVMAIMQFIISNRMLDLDDSAIRNWWKLALGGLNWLLTKQKEDGSWQYEYRSRDDLTSSSFYAVEAMTLARFCLCKLKPGAYNAIAGRNDDKDLIHSITSACSKALKWYETSYKLMSGEEGGWAWWEQDESSAVQNTAASLIVLLDMEWLSESSPLARQTMKWLLSNKDIDSWWQLDTPLVIKAAIRVLHPPSRLGQKLNSLQVQSK